MITDCKVDKGEVGEEPYRSGGCETHRWIDEVGAGSRFSLAGKNYNKETPSEYQHILKHTFWCLRHEFCVLMRW